MSTTLMIWLGLAGAVVLEGLVWHVVIYFICRTKPVLDPHSYETPPDPAPRISVVVAARNEEDNIEACIRTLLAQDYPNFEIIAVDDRSEDGTLNILKRLEADAGGVLQVVQIHELEDGWFGKNNAMREGVARSSGEWFCFTDADCWFPSTATLTVGMRDALAHDADFLSLLACLDERTTWERLIQPACAIMMVSWFLPLRVNNPKDKLAYANGQFMLTTRTCYEGIGGHHRVRAELNEDMVMASLVKQEGFKLRLVENHGLSMTRMYDSLSAAWHGWSRIFHGSIPSIAQLGLAAFWHIVFAVGPWISLAVALIGFIALPSTSGVPWSTVLLCWAVAVLVHQTVLWRVYGLMHFKPVWSWGHVLGASMVVGMLISAIAKSLGLTSTTWRGVTYRSGKLERDAIAPGAPSGAPQAVLVPEENAKVLTPSRSIEDGC